MNLQLSLKRKLFEMTKAGIKTEDYREITPYWCKRLLVVTEDGIFDWDTYLNKEEDAKQLLSIGIANIFFKVKSFQFNIMTLGYPCSSDWERIIHLKHEGIEIREGNPEWGAEKGRLYFVIKHGS